VSLYHKSAIATGTEPLLPRQRRLPAPQLNPMMPCDTAFRVIARRYLNELMSYQDATCSGDATALHQMRVSLTRLRTVILFYSPMVADTERQRIRDELKWLNSQLGAVRDLDVAIERLNTVNQDKAHAEPYYRSWSERRAGDHRRLARALRSTRYRRLVRSLSDWIENGPWSTAGGRQAAKERACPIAEYGTEKLARWQQRLLKKSRRLLKMDAEKRHRLRLLNKKLTYSIEACEDLFSDKEFSQQPAALKYLRKAQRALGQLNDDERGQSLAATLQRDGARSPWRFIKPKREKRLLRAAIAAYGKLDALAK
jgi:CHAD domain-containing protein